MSMRSPSLPPALAGFFGSDAGLSASTVARLTEAWQAEHASWAARDLSARDYVYIWCDGVHFTIRLEDAALCCLVIVGVRPDGSKELVAVADGYRESTDAWGDLLRDLRERGMRPPEVAVGDGALGLWAALRDVFPTTRAQRDWVHKAANVLSALPARAHVDAKAALGAIYRADTRAGALNAARAFVVGGFRSAWSKARSGSYRSAMSSVTPCSATRRATSLCVDPLLSGTASPGFSSGTSVRAWSEGVSGSARVLATGGASDS